jgi:hypothetical protein
MSVTGEDEGVPCSGKKRCGTKESYRTLLAVTGIALHHGGSKERELFDPAFDEGGKKTKASSAKFN